MSTLCQRIRSYLVKTQGVVISDVLLGCSSDSVVVLVDRHGPLGGLKPRVPDLAAVKSVDLLAGLEQAVAVPVEKMMTGKVKYQTPDLIIPLSAGLDVK